MTLHLHKSEIYADPYRTNLFYLRNLTELQMIPLEEMKWIGAEINGDLWSVPWAWIDKKNTKDSAEGFMKRLNEELRRL